MKLSTHIPLEYIKQNELKNILDYNKDKGVFTWKIQGKARSNN